MTTPPLSDSVQAIAALQANIDDQQALLSNPDVYTKWLTARANAALRHGLIDDDALREMLEQIDAAYEWAKEELLDR